jgi:hypothetical protein
VSIVTETQRAMSTCTTSEPRGCEVRKKVFQRDDLCAATSLSSINFATRGARLTTIAVALESLELIRKIGRARSPRRTEANCLFALYGRRRRRCMERRRPVAGPAQVARLHRASQNFGVSKS